MSGPEASSTSLTVRAAVAFEAYRGGDGQAMSDLVDMLTPLLWHVARGQQCGIDLAEEAIQTAWSRLVDSHETIREPKAVVGWLVTTVKREVWRGSRAAQRLVSDDEVPERPDERLDPAVAAVLSERQKLLWRHVAGLSQRCRYLLRVIAFSDRPDYAAVSEALGMPQGSIGPNRGRCLTKLRAALLADPRWEA